MHRRTALELIGAGLAIGLAPKTRAVVRTRGQHRRLPPLRGPLELARRPIRAPKLRAPKSGDRLTDRATLTKD